MISRILFLLLYEEQLIVMWRKKGTSNKEEDLSEVNYWYRDSENFENQKLNLASKEYLLDCILDSMIVLYYYAFVRKPFDRSMQRTKKE
jgi:hypothetical protein